MASFNPLLSLRGSPRVVQRVSSSFQSSSEFKIKNLASAEIINKTSFNPLLSLSIYAELINIL